MTEFATTRPLHALQLLRSTMGCCRVEYLRQALPESDIVLSLAQTATSSLRAGLSSRLSHPCPQSLRMLGFLHVLLSALAGLA